MRNKGSQTIKAYVNACVLFDTLWLIHKTVNWIFFCWMCTCLLIIINRFIKPTLQITDRNENLRVDHLETVNSKTFATGDSNQVLGCTNPTLAPASS